MKNILLILTTITILISCNKEQESTKISNYSTDLKSIELEEPRKFTLSELKRITDLDSVSVRKELKKVGFLPLNINSNYVFVDSLYLDKVKDKKVGIGYYLILKSPVITYDKDLKHISLTFPTNQLSYYLQLVNEETEKLYEKETSNIFYERKNIYLPKIRFKPLDYSSFSEYDITIYEDYSNIFMTVRIL